MNLEQRVRSDPVAGSEYPFGRGSAGPSGLQRVTAWGSASGSVPPETTSAGGSLLAGLLLLALGVVVYLGGGLPSLVAAAAAFLGLLLVLAVVGPLSRLTVTVLLYVVKAVALVTVGLIALAFLVGLAGG
jgi:hypothetical protein